MRSAMHVIRGSSTPQGRCNRLGWRVDGGEQKAIYCEKSCAATTTEALRLANRARTLAQERAARTLWL
jgi:hypothetical protein